MEKDSCQQHFLGSFVSSLVFREGHRCSGPPCWDNQSRGWHLGSMRLLGCHSQGMISGLSFLFLSQVTFPFCLNIPFCSYPMRYICPKIGENTTVPTKAYVARISELKAARVVDGWSELTRGLAAHSHLSPNTPPTIQRTSNLPRYLKVLRLAIGIFAVPSLRPYQSQNVLQSIHRRIPRERRTQPQSNLH